MENETSGQYTKNSCWSHWGMKKHMCGHGCRGALYGLGFLGALVYYLTTATSLTGGVIGFLKALLWPAFLVYGVLKFIGA